MNASVGSIDGIDRCWPSSSRRSRSACAPTSTTGHRDRQADPFGQPGARRTVRTCRRPPRNDDAELLRQTLRSLKELQAGLANDVLSPVDRRFQAMSDQLHKESQSTAEAMLNVAEV